MPEEILEWHKTGIEIMSGEIEYANLQNSNDVPYSGETLAAFWASGANAYIPFSKLPEEVADAIVCLLYTSPSPRD